MDDTQLNALVDAIVRELKASGAVKPASSSGTPALASATLPSSSATPAQPRANYQLPITNLTDLRPSTFNLLVNTTPVGMTPNIDHSPLPENLSLPSNAFVYDLIYNPRERKLVKDARAQGLNASTGLGMLIEQAALAFEKWTGHIPPREILYQAVEP